MRSAADFFSGAAAMASLVAALYFLRFWLRTADRFFAFFALGFAAFAVNRLVLIFVRGDNENSAYVYVIRLAAFALILLAVLEKNRADR